MKNSYKTLRLILGDQLNYRHSWFRDADPSVLYVIAELHQETNYVRHHIQKVCGFFAAMNAFAEHLSAQGHQVLHLDLDQTVEFTDLNIMISHLTSQYAVTSFEYQQPDEYRLSQQLQSLQLDSSIDVCCHDSEHFLLAHEELAKYLNPNKHNRMESFYRKMRKRFNILMDGDQPLGERWNFDAENRQKLKPADIQEIPQPLLFSNDISSIQERLGRHNIETIGNCSKHLIWPVNRQQALELLNFFCTQCLPLFGRFQDAMTYQSEQRWSLYHARISFALNCKILHPSEVVQAALDRYYSAKESIELAQVEGFVRQIIGWREYIRGVYWVNMPHYKDLNQLDARNPLPDYFWTGDTTHHKQTAQTTHSTHDTRTPHPPHALYTKTRHTHRSHTHTTNLYRSWSVSRGLQTLRCPSGSSAPTSPAHTAYMKSGPRTKGEVLYSLPGARGALATLARSRCRL